MQALTVDTGERRQTIFSLADAIADLEAMIEQAQEAGDDLTAEALFQALEATEGQVQQKFEHILALMAGCKSRHETRTRFKADFDALNKVDDHKVERMRGLLAYAMERMSLDKVQTTLGTVIRNKPKIDLGQVDDQAAFEHGLGTATVTIVVTGDADNLRALAKEAVGLAGLDRGEVSLSLTVRTPYHELVSALRDVSNECFGRIAYSYAADKDKLVELAELDLAPKDATDATEPLVPPVVAQPKYTRTLVVKGVKG